MCWPFENKYIYFKLISHTLCSKYFSGPIILYILYTYKIKKCWVIFNLALGQKAGSVPLTNHFFSVLVYLNTSYFVKKSLDLSIHKHVWELDVSLQNPKRWHPSRSVRTNVKCCTATVSFTLSVDQEINHYIYKEMKVNELALCSQCIMGPISRLNVKRCAQS